MKLKKIQVIGAFALAGILAISSLNVGYAAWNTEISATGNSTAYGNWDIAVTDASIKLSGEGAAASALLDNAMLSDMEEDTAVESETKEDAEEEIEEAKEEESVEEETESIEEEPSGGEPESTEEKLTEETSENIEGDKEEPAEEESKSTVGADSTETLNDGASDSGETLSLMNEIASKLDRKILIVGSQANAEDNFVEDLSDLIELTGNSIEYPEIVFSLPGAWAEYTITVTNNGTADAKLTQHKIELVSDDSTKLVLDVPDLENEVLKAGDSCTFTFTIKVPDDIQDTNLNVTGTLKAALSYEPLEVEPMPEPSHTNHTKN